MKHGFTVAGAAVDRIAGPSWARIDRRVRRMRPETAGTVVSFVVLAMIAGVLGVRQLTRDADAYVEAPVEALPAESGQASAETLAPVARIERADFAPNIAPRSAVLPQIGEAFIDRFDGETLNQRWFLSDGWSNGVHWENSWSKDQVSIGPEGLTLKMQRAAPGADKPLVSAEMQSAGVFRYGYFEIRMRAPKGDGIVTGFFTYAGAQNGRPPNEIDVEIIGRNTKRVELVTHAGVSSRMAPVRVPGDAAKDFHVYGFDWQPDYVRWYLDGKLVHQITGAHAHRLVNPQKLIINLWGSRTLHEWVGDLDGDGGPWELTTSCVAYAPTFGGDSLCEPGVD